MAVMFIELLSLEPLPPINGAKNRLFYIFKFLTFINTVSHL
jgi:hypothetical protein